MGGIDGRLLDRLKPGPRLRELSRAMLDMVMPPVAFDGGARPQQSGLSEEAWTRVAFLEDPVCDGCGAAFDHDAGPLGHDRCVPCQTSPHVFARARAACVYDEASRDLILQLKHADRLEYAPLFSRWLTRAAAPLLEEADAIVPVPLHWTRLLARRANQAAEVARPLARAAGRDYLPQALVRTQRTPTQGGRSARGRRLNVKSAFAVPETMRKAVRGRRLLLVDDVLTTGATANACARALMAAGARSVDLAVIARVRNRR